jgi:hypothetical protein
VLKTDWKLSLPFSSLMLSSPFDFDYVLPTKTINAPPPKTYAAVVATLAFNEQIDNIKKVYDEKMVNLDKQLSQEVKQHQLEEKRMKYIITQLVHQKQELEDKLTKTPFTSSVTKTTNTKPPAPSFSILKKPSPANPKSNVKYNPVTSKEALTLKTPAFIKFN